MPKGNPRPFHLYERKREGKLLVWYVRDIQELLGHEGIATTQVYTHVDPERLRQVHSKFHQRGKEKS
jgi:integrase